MSGTGGGFYRRQGEPRRGVSLSRRQCHRSDDVGTRPPGYVSVASSPGAGWYKYRPSQPRRHFSWVAHPSQTPLSPDLSTAAAASSLIEITALVVVQAGPVVALGRVILLYASQRTPGILSGVFSVIWERGNTRLFDVWSFRGSRLLPLLAAAPSLPIPVGQRTPG